MPRSVLDAAYVAALEDLESTAARYRRAVIDEQRGTVTVAECSRLGRQLDAMLVAVQAQRDRRYISKEK